MATGSCIIFLDPLHLISKYLQYLKKLWWEENWLDTFGCPLEPTTFIAIPMRPTGFSLDGRTNPVAMNGYGYSYYSEGMEVSQVSVSILGSGHVQGASKWTPFKAKGLCVHCQHRNGFPVVDKWKLSESCMTGATLSKARIKSLWWLKFSCSQTSDWDPWRIIHRFYSDVSKCALRDSLDFTERVSEFTGLKDYLWPSSKAWKKRYKANSVLNFSAYQHTNSPNDQKRAIWSSFLFFPSKCPFQRCRVHPDSRLSNPRTFTEIDPFEIKITSIQYIYV